VGRSWVNFSKVSDSDGSIRSKAIRFDEDVGLLEPCEEVVVFASELDVAEASVTQHVASDAHVCLISVVDSRSCHFEKLLKFVFACR